MTQRHVCKHLEEEEEIYLAQTQQIMQKQIIYNTTEPGYRKTRRSTMPATLTHA